MPWGKPASPYSREPSRRRHTLRNEGLPRADPHARTSIYLLNLFLAFLQPKFDPALAADIAESEVEEGAPGLPTSMPAPGAASSGGGNAYGELQDGEFRPFIRRLPEFKFWWVPFGPRTAHGLG